MKQQTRYIAAYLKTGFKRHAPGQVTAGYKKHLAPEMEAIDALVKK